MHNGSYCPVNYPIEIIANGLATEKKEPKLERFFCNALTVANEYKKRQTPSLNSVITNGVRYKMQN